MKITSLNLHFGYLLQHNILMEYIMQESTDNSGNKNIFIFAHLEMYIVIQMQDHPYPAVNRLDISNYYYMLYFAFSLHHADS